MRKLLSQVFLALATCSCAIGQANELIREIYQKAQEIDCSRNSEDELLFNLYSQEITKLDPETLEANPELVFRKAVAWWEIIGSEATGIEEAKHQLALLRNDLEFVTRLTPADSRIFKAAKLRKDIIDNLLTADPQTEEALVELAQVHLDCFLKQWAPQSSASGIELRKDVYANLIQSKELLNSFFDFILLLEDNPDIILGRIPLDDIQLIKNPSQNNENEGLSYMIKYTAPNGYIITKETEV